MNIFLTFIVLLLALIGLVAGIYYIILVVFKRPGIEAVDKGKIGFPFSLGHPILNRINCVWIGIILVVFCGSLIFSLIKETFFK